MLKEWGIVLVWLGIFWALRSLFWGLEYLAIWQTKEYRADRMKAHLATKSGRALVWGVSVKARIVFLATVYLCYLLVFLVDLLISHSLASQIAIYYLLIVVGAGLGLCAFLIYEILHKIQAFGTGLGKRPVFTKKAILLLIIVSGLVLFYGLLPLILIFPGRLLERVEYQNAFVGFLLIPCLPLIYLIGLVGYPLAYLSHLAILDLLYPYWYRLAVLVLDPLSHLAKLRTIRAAKKKMRGFKQLQVVAITGSYGKTSTKEFIANLLASKYKVSKTPKNNNTEIGLAQAILRDLKPDDQFFIVEMGAYKKGEIAKMCELAPPNLSVVTAVNEQHLALFGSIEQTMQAKYEIVEGLGSLGTAFFNADDKNCCEMATWYAGKKSLYSIKGRYQVQGIKTSLLAMGIKDVDSGVSFDFVDNTDSPDKYNMHVSALTEQYVPNLLAAMSVVHELGMTWKEIIEAVKNLPKIEHAVTLTSGLNGIQILNDNYSSNPDGFEAALTKLSTVKGAKKVVITKGMLELGSETLAQHRRIGAKLAKTADLLVLLSHDYEEGLRQGIGQQSSKLVTIVEDNPRKALNYLRNNLHKNDVVLLEGRVSPVIVNGLQSSKQ